MKVTTLFTFISALFVAVNALTVSKPRNQLEEKALIDVCVYIDLDVDAGLSDILSALGLVDVCVCLSALPLIIEAHASVLADLNILNILGVLADLTALITSGKYHECSPTPSSKIKRNLALADAQCPWGLSLCGVQSPWARTAWECVDTMRDLESCGGCTVGLLNKHASGQDCTEIPEVEDVACRAGTCEVYSCRYGFEPSEDRTSCVAAATHGHHFLTGSH